MNRIAKGLLNVGIFFFDPVANVKGKKDVNKSKARKQSSCLVGIAALGSHRNFSREPYLK